MGAATVLMASELSLPPQVRGIIADCPYSTSLAIIRKVGRDMHLPAGVSAFLASVSARLFGHFDLAASSPVEAVRHSPVPILLIHGEDDHFVPCEMSRRIADANPVMIERHTFPGAVHGLSYLVDTDRYTELVHAFCDRIFEE